MHGRSGEPVKYEIRHKRSLNESGGGLKTGKMECRGVEICWKQQRAEGAEEDTGSRSRSSTGVRDES